MDGVCDMDGMGGMGAMMGWWMLGGAVAVLVVLGLAVFGVVQLLRRGHAPSAGSGPMSRRGAPPPLRRR